MVSDARCGLRRVQVAAAGGLEEFQHRLVFEGWGVSVLICTEN
jgi:hypothetical protein